MNKERNRKDVNDGSRESHQRGVEAVKHTAMAWQDVAAILDADCAFE